MKLMAIVTLLWYFGALCLVQCSVSRGDELNTTLIPLEDASHCKDADSCADNTPGTGHVLFSNLTDAVWAVEQCYSYCLANTSQDEQSSGVADFYDDSGEKCLKLQEAYICLSACLYVKTAAVQAVNISVGSSLSLQGNPSCSDLCSAENGLCERAFSPTADSDCVTNCKNGDRCTQFCEIARNMEVNSNTIELPASLNGTLTLSLSPSDKDNGTLYKQGVMEINNTAGVPSDQYGIVWRVTSENEEFFIPQHLPFILLPGEVGPLYRTGSNLLAIQQFQCKQNLHLSYALVSSAGRTNFSQPLPQCFKGNGFPHPPSGIHVSFGFEEMSSDLRLEVTVDHLSPDHSTVTAYGVQVYDLTDSQLNTRVLFPDRENLTLVLVGEDAENAFPPSSRPIQYLIGVYALPQPNISISGRMLIPTSNWVSAMVAFPSFPRLNGTICYTATLNRASNTTHFAFRYTIHSGWKSLAPVSKLEGKLTENGLTEIPGFGQIPIPKLFYPDSTLKTEVNNFTYVFEFEDVNMSVDDGHSFRFYFRAISLYSKIRIHPTGESEVHFKPLVYAQNEDQFTTCPTRNETMNENGTRDSAANKALLSIIMYIFILVSILIN